MSNLAKVPGVALNTPFRSFFLGGFESAYQINCYGHRIDMIASTKHDIFAQGDYARAREIGIRTVRDAMRWYLIDRGARFDLSSFLPMLEASIKEDIQVIWTLCHYGWPDDLDIFSGKFVDRFERYARKMAEVLVDHGIESPLIIPFNEISYFCHAICGEGDMYPHALGRSWELKKQIVRATIAGIEAIRSVAHRARIVHVDPIIHVVPPRDRPDLAAAAASRKRSQYEAAELIAGRIHPELGGREEYLDLVGVNFYHANQWEDPGDKTIFWHHKPRDDRWKPFSELLREAEATYQRPLFIAETSHVGEGRPEWIRETLHEILLAVEQGTTIYGVCLYPLIDRHCWADESHWHNSGIWDIDHRRGYERTLCEEYFEAFSEMRRLFAHLDPALSALRSAVEPRQEDTEKCASEALLPILGTNVPPASDSYTRALSIADDI
jgi:beta-glucosidase/6-phospho-beta-glucosidase/beta-galactosidase